MNWYEGYLYGREHHADLLREAEVARLVASLPPRPSRLSRATRQASAWLGARLVAWGSALQQSAQVAHAGSL